MSEREYAYNRIKSDIINGQLKPGERLIEKEEAGINLYAFVKGVEFPEGQAQSDSFIYVIEGEIVYTVGDIIFNLKKGQTITIPASATYHLMVKEKVKIMVVWFKKDKIIGKKPKN